MRAPSRFPEPSLTRLTVPAGALLAAALAALPLPDAGLWDALNRARPDPAPPRVAVVAIDQGALWDYGRLGVWPPELYTQVVATLLEAGAVGVGLDLPLEDLDAALTGTQAFPEAVLAAPAGRPLPTPRPGQRAVWGVDALNAGPGGLVRWARAGVREAAGPVTPAFTALLAQQAGARQPLTAEPYLLRIPATPFPVLPFRDVVNGAVAPGAVRGRVVIVGLTAAGAARVQDTAGRVMPGAFMQARAVQSLLSPPLTPLPAWAVVLGAMLVTALVTWARGLWGHAAAFGLLGLGAALWPAGVLFPGVTLSLCAVLGNTLVLLERQWTLRTAGRRDPLTGYGNRQAFNAALARRRSGGLILLDLSGFRGVNDRYGRAAGDAVLRDLGRRLGRYGRRGDRQFRWGADEFALLLNGVGQPDVARLAEALQAEVSELPYQDVMLRGNVGAAAFGPDIPTPQALVEAAGRQRYLRKHALRKP